MTTPFEGTCNCGAITVRIHDPDLFTRKRGHTCRCENCRKTSSTAVSNNLIIENEKIEILGEENLQEYKDPKTLSGNVLGRWFCRVCGNPIRSITPNFPGKTILKLGIFPKIPSPEWEAFAENTFEWEQKLPGIPRYKTTVKGEKMEGSP